MAWHPTDLHAWRDALYPDGEAGHDTRVLGLADALVDVHRHALNRLKRLCRVSPLLSSGIIQTSRNKYKPPAFTLVDNRLSGAGV
jgi:hypothetical protein